MGGGISGIPIGQQLPDSVTIVKSRELEKWSRLRGGLKQKNEMEDEK